MDGSSGLSAKPKFMMLLVVGFIKGLRITHKVSEDGHWIEHPQIHFIT